ncbi:reverse transcriptase domain-containing protein [Tanacetum coccineum]
MSDIKGISPSYCTHRILMEDDYKLAIQPQRHLNPKVQDMLKNEIVKLLDSRLIYPISDSSWVSPIHVVLKKRGMTIVLNDNNELIPSRTITGWICTDEDQEKTTFTCPYGTFAYRRMSFGLCNTSATFQRCMTAIFHDMVEDFMEVFMDEFSVFGNSFDCCQANLDKILARCEETNLELNWEKYHFMVKEGIVLGHKMSRARIEVDRAKINVIAKLPYPTNVKGVRRKLRDGEYENTKIYKEKAKRWHDSRFRGDKNFKVGDKSVPALSPVSGALSPVRADLIPSPKRVKDSGYLADVEVDPREISLRDDAIVRVSDEPHLEQDIDPEIQAEIDECIAYADALRDRGIDARVVVEAVDRDETETGVRGPVEVRVERVTHPVMPEDIPEPAQEGAVEVTYETLGDLVQRFHDHTQAILVYRIQAIEGVQREQGHRIIRVESAVIALTERIAELERDNMRLKGTASVESQIVDRRQRGMSRMQRELRQMRRLRFYDRVRVGRLEACARKHMGYHP